MSKDKEKTTREKWLITWLFITNNEGHEAVGWHIQNAFLKKKRKESQPKNLYPAKLTFKK